MQQMHQGQIPGPPNATPSLGAHNAQQQQVSFGAAQNGNNGHGSSNATKVASSSGMSSNGVVNGASATATSLDDLVSGAARDADTAENKAELPIGEKKVKKDKDKDKPTKLVYSDNEMSPEEKMAKLPRYAFVPDRKPEVVLGEATTAAVTGVSIGFDDVLDLPV